MTYTVKFTFGTPDTNLASGMTPCVTLEDARRNASKVWTDKHQSPIWSVQIIAGDHAPMLVNGTWTYPAEMGWLSTEREG